MFDLTSIKQDNRPKKGGWAPGEYYHSACVNCGAAFIGDKWAVECADCAYARELQPGERTFKEFTPLHIELMLHYHVSPAKHERYDNEVVQRYTADLLKCELIEETDEFESGFKSTKRGKAFVDKLCNTALPKQVWV